MTISSNFDMAQQKATAIGNAISSLSSVADVTIDSQTTVSGNASAKEAIHGMVKSGFQISQAVQVASKNIQSVAQEFESIEQSIKQEIFGPTGNFP